MDLFVAASLLWLTFDSSWTAIAGTVAVIALRQLLAGTLASDFAALTVGVWDTRTKRRLFAFSDERTTINSLAWSSDRRLLAVGTQGGGLSIWNLPNIRKQLSSLALDWPNEADHGTHQGENRP